MITLRYATEVVNSPHNLLKGLKLSKEDIQRWRIKSLNQACRLISRYAKDKNHHRYVDDLKRARELGLPGLTKAIHYSLKDPSGKYKYGERGFVYIEDKEAPYAKYQIEGTEAHGPVHAKRLRFFSRRYGHWISKYWVKGIVKDDFIHNAVVRTRLNVREIFEDNLRRLLDGKL